MRALRRAVKTDARVKCTHRDRSPLEARSGALSCQRMLAFLFIYVQRTAVVTVCLIAVVIILFWATKWWIWCGSPIAERPRGALYRFRQHDGS